VAAPFASSSLSFDFELADPDFVAASGCERVSTSRECVVEFARGARGTRGALRKRQRRRSGRSWVGGFKGVWAGGGAGSYNVLALILSTAQLMRARSLKLVRPAATLIRDSAIPTRMMRS